MQTEAIYGEAPIDLGRIDICPVEMMFWQYCPIKLPGTWDTITPPNLRQFWPVVNAALDDCKARWFESYIYITAKTMWVSPENPGNRPGWHSDGFLTDDLNYVWSDVSPTVYWEPPQRIAFRADHNLSLYEMRAAAEHDTGNHKRYADKHLMRLDQRVIHKVDDRAMGGMRSFVKVSVSHHPYALIGNSINHALPTNWTYAPRSVERNDPIAGATPTT